jgi:hypothetical protein
VSDDQQPECRCLSEYYIIIFLNKQKIVGNARHPPSNEKFQNKTSMAKAMGLFRDSHAFLDSQGPRPMYRLSLLLIGHD